MAKRQRVLLTGGCGLVGSTLTPLLKDEYEVTHFEVKDPGHGLPFIQGDLRSSMDVAGACTDMDAVVHVAGVHGKAWKEAGDDVGFEVNVTGTKNILGGAVKAGVKRVVFTSSVWANGHGAPPPEYLPIDEKLQREPAELYGLTKILGEQMCRYATEKHGISTIVLRPGGIRPAELYGPNQISLLTTSVDVRDVAQAQALALQAPEEMAHEVFIVTADSPLSRVNPDTFRTDPGATLDTVVPGSAKRIQEGAFTIGPNVEWYSVEKAKQMLGYDPKFNFVLG